MFSSERISAQTGSNLSRTLPQMLMASKVIEKQQEPSGKWQGNPLSAVAQHDIRSNFAGRTDRARLPIAMMDAEMDAARMELRPLCFQQSSQPDYGFKGISHNTILAAKNFSTIS